MTKYQSKTLKPEEQELMTQVLNDGDMIRSVVLTENQVLTINWLRNRGIAVTPAQYAAHKQISQPNSYTVLNVLFKKGYLERSKTQEPGQMNSYKYKVRAEFAERPKK